MALPSAADRARGQPLPARQAHWPPVFSTNWVAPARQPDAVRGRALSMAARRRGYTGKRLLRLTLAALRPPSRAMSPIGALFFA